MRRYLAVALSAAVLAAVSACGGSSPEEPGTDASGPSKVTVGVIPIVDVAPIYLGKEKGFFSSRGIDLELVTAQGGAAIVPGVLSGDFQFGFSNITSLMIAQTKNVPVRIVANGAASTGVPGKDFGGVAVAKDSPITSAAGLAGRKVAVNTLKNIGDTTVRESVRKAGGDPAGIEFVEIGFPDMPAALESGQVDAAWVVEPQLSAVKAAGGTVIASNFTDTAPNLTIAAYFAGTKLIADEPELVKNFTEAINESLAYADAHPDEVRAVLSSYTKISEEVRTALILPKWPTEVNRASLATLAALGTTDGIFGDAAPDLGKLLP
ncbi:NitT/TauT family transport system substrate-binding protein [Catenuloplanes nepalensis]|uniref:NitT/TauT family transport system substrate-binding protein n=1 Tax=Catenuloplanes nepalensis TaxID=587533 RepID=A0ABT9MZ11_9ACTN|nr:ABC transporter substrate-binding protein [Catenuloplanes nepalensis]MDP9796689.1 NitT/TauT family transport system substrate-binding protein [Catenuloplanes nepalensis]